MTFEQDMFAAKVLIQFAHPALHKSRINSKMLGAVESLPGITLNNLYDAYPDMDIDVTREQRLMEAADIVVFQCPFYWYSTPAIIKEWLDLVLEHGWAYGRHGKALAGKKALLALTTGGTAEAYQKGGYNRYTIAELLRPLEQTFYLCGMEYLTPFVVHGTHLLGPEEMDQHAADYGRLMAALRDDRVDFAAATNLERLGGNLDEIIVS